MTQRTLTPTRRARAFAATRRRFFHPSSRRALRHDNEGSILIITFSFLIMASLIVVTLSSWASNGLNNTVHFKTAANELYAADGVTQIAIRAARYSYPPTLSLTSPVSEVCPGTPSPIDSIDRVSVQVWCDTYLLGSNIRVTTLTACLTTSQLTGACTTAGGNVPQLLVATVNFYDDTFNSTPCSSTIQSNCGGEMEILSWETR